MPDFPDDDLILEQMTIPLDIKPPQLPDNSSTEKSASAASTQKNEIPAPPNLNIEPIGAVPTKGAQLSLPSPQELESQLADLKVVGEQKQEAVIALPDYSSLLQEKDSGGIEILVQMAQKGELDPKNIDIIDATDRFLKAVAAAPRENLRQSGKIIFHASVLLRLKAEALLITRIEDLDAVTDDFMDFDMEGSPIIYDSNDEAVGRQITLADLQRALVRRSRQQKQSRQRRVTLEQLIESLREAERIDKKRQERKQREPEQDAIIAMDGYHAMEDMADILDLAHDEDIEDVIVRIEHLLVRIMTDMLRISLKELLGQMGGKGDWVDAFLAVLFLSNAGKITLEQEVFYGPLYLTRSDATQELTATGTDGVVGSIASIHAEFDPNKLIPKEDDSEPEASNVIDIRQAKEKKAKAKPATKKSAAAAAKTTRRPKSIIKKKAKSASDVSNEEDLDDTNPKNDSNNFEARNSKSVDNGSLMPEELVEPGDTALTDTTDIEQ